MILFLFLPFILSFILIPPVSEDSVGSYKGTKELNIEIVKRELITKDEADLFKTLFAQTQPQLFNVIQDEQQQTDYDDHLPTSIIVYKSKRSKESDKDFVDRLRELNCGKGDQAPTKYDYATVFEEDVFSVSTLEEEEAIKVKTLEKKLIKNSVLQYLNQFNDLVYVINGTYLNLVSQL
ncbi:hypothetical protein CLIB1444_18S01508 [[Candida] jaroonii]|uniref:Uncharacterized protein n=1 Tax=[Candida] jaroonii TaxID=467808 RepID=A0ACA9YF38_9ASCO|nr:hypothetical protein CLIB1444_18S01508 [[Candida] jaroonii]